MCIGEVLFGQECKEILEQQFTKNMFLDLYTLSFCLA